MSLVSIFQQLQAAANIGGDVAHLEEELKQILATGQGVAADVTADIKQVEVLVAEAKEHKLSAVAALDEAKVIAEGVHRDIAEISALLPVLKDLASKAPELLKLLAPAESAK